MTQQPSSPFQSSLDRTTNVARSIHVLIAGLLGGPLLLCGGLAILIFSEQTGARDTLALDEGQRKVVAADAERIDPELDGKLIHVSSVTTISGPVEDQQFGIAADAVKLERIVEMLQWVEQLTIKAQVHGYRTEWKSELIDSTRFRQKEGHHNPNYFPFEPITELNPQVKFGAYRLNPSQIHSIPAAEQREITEDEFKATVESIMIPGQLVRGELQLYAVDWVPTAAAEKINPAYQPRPGPQEVGNIRIRYQLARPGELTVVAKQSGESFLPFATSADHIELVRVGSHNVEGMFEQERSDKWYVAWVLRMVSLFCVTIGCWGLAFAFSSVAWLTGAANDLPSHRFGCIGTIILCAVVIVVAWHQIDPLFVATTVAIAVLLLVGIGWTFRRPRPAAEASTADEIITAEFVHKDPYPVLRKPTDPGSGFDAYNRRL